MRHLILCGERGSGKSTAAEEIAKASGLLVYGFQTKKRLCGPLYNVYIHPALRERTYTPENLAGICLEERPRGDPRVFDQSAGLIASAPRGSLIVMDELGTMEKDAEAFQAAVLHAFDREDVAVLATLRQRPSPFLERVLCHRSATVLRLAPENRREIVAEALAILKAPPGKAGAAFPADR